MQPKLPKMNVELFHDLELHSLQFSKYREQLQGPLVQVHAQSNEFGSAVCSLRILECLAKPFSQCQAVGL